MTQSEPAGGDRRATGSGLSALPALWVGVVILWSIWGLSQIALGSYNYELPDSVTEADIAENLRKYYSEIAIPADSFANAVAFAMSQPDEVDVNEILFRPTRQML